MVVELHRAPRPTWDGPDWDDMTDEHLASSGHGPEGVESPKSSCLENLPAELRALIFLSAPDLPTLRSLVRASPVLHAQYRHDRNRILRACLSRELDGFLIDAYATAMSWVQGFVPRTDKTITNYLNTYGVWLSSSTPFPDINSVDPDRIRWMAAYHISVARPLARLYSHWTLTNLKKAIVLSSIPQGTAPMEVDKLVEEGLAAQGDHPSKLSRSEEIRLFRALYRYGTYHHLFGEHQGQRRGGLGQDEIQELFFCLFNPWEAEAVGCIDTFVGLRYENLFNQVKADLHPKNPKFRQENGVYNPEGSYDLEMEYDDYLYGTMGCGLKMTARLLMIDDHEKLVSEMQRCLTHFQVLDGPMREVLGSMAQYDRRQMSTNFPNARDEAELRRDPIHFVGDTVPPDGPPSAWVVLWGGNYSNIYGEYVPQSVKQWGYVMWDKRRWIGMGAEEDLIVGQWKTSPELVKEIKRDYNWSPM
ncbi:hypothetical protein GGR58DRAFT_518298 [Xylaria digitata]|nr:hypothetical protein GGR58DRAFT_518298 [Xylaria digitata]